MYIYPWSTHISWSTPSALISFDPLFSGAVLPEALILYWKSRDFYHLSPKDPTVCVKTPQIVIYMLPKDPIFTENSLIFVTKRPFFFLF